MKIQQQRGRTARAHSTMLAGVLARADRPTQDAGTHGPMMSLEELHRSRDLCAAMAEMSASMRQVMGVLRRHNCITAVPDAHLHEYVQAMDALAAAVARANTLGQCVRQCAHETLDNLPAAVMLRQ